MSPLKKIPEKPAAPVISDDLRHAISRLKGEKPGPDLTTPENLERLRAVSTEISREEEFQKSAEADIVKNLAIGQLIPGKGVFIGTKDLQDKDGQILGTFNLFAAPHDLGLDEKGWGQKLLTNFNNAAKAAAEIANLLGHRGVNYANDIALYTAIRSGQYKGEWFIPPKAILRNDVYENEGRGVLKGTFTKTFLDLACCYWTCTEHQYHPHAVEHVRFSDGNGGAYPKDDSNAPLSTRLVRVEPQSPGIM